MVNSAIILAPDEKGNQPIFGIPAIRRLTLLALRLGVSSIHIVGRVNGLIPVLSDLLPGEAFHELEDPSRLDRVDQWLPLTNGESVLVMKANHVIDLPSLKLLIETGQTGFCCREANGKHTPEGISVTNGSNIGPLLSAMWSPDPSHFNLKHTVQPQKSGSGLPCLVGDRKEDQKAAEAKLATALFSQPQESDGFLARHLDRHLSRSISRKLAHTRVTPNQVTLMGVAVGLTGAFFLSQPGYWFQLAGSLLFLFCVVIDGVDGEIARLRLQESLFGHYLDVVTDNIVHVAIFVGIAFGLYREIGDGRYLQLLWLLLAGFGLCVVVVYFAILRRTPEEIGQSPRTLQFMSYFTNRDFAYLVVAFSLIHRLNWFFISATAGTYIFAAILWMMSRRERAKA